MSKALMSSFLTVDTWSLRWAKNNAECEFVQIVRVDRRKKAPLDILFIGTILLNVGRVTISSGTMDVDKNLPIPHKANAHSVSGGGKEETESDVAVQDGPPDTTGPRKYKVILLNDDYTTMDFVVEVLKRFFNKAGEEAVVIMLQVHEEGRGVCGVYSLEIAETKVAQVHEFARTGGYPLKCTMEPL